MSLGYFSYPCVVFQSNQSDILEGDYIEHVLSDGLKS